jgi:outer membrane protein TolC
MQRLFNAGQIDFIAKTYVLTQYGEVHTKLMQAEMDVHMAHSQLQLFTGINDSLLVEAMVPLNSADAADMLEADSQMVKQSVFNQYYEHTKLISWNEWKLEKNKALPGFAFGYMNQGAKDSEIPLRLRGGITIPIWFWQYHASIRAAKIKIAVTDQQAKAQQQNLQSKIQQAKTEVVKTHLALKYYSEKGLQETEAIIAATQRMLDAGVSDYITYLRTLSEAYTMRLNAIEAIKNYNQSIINLNYLTGKK